MHSIHFAFALGCFAAPVIAEPFLGRKLTELEDHIVGTTVHNFTSEINSTDLNKVLEKEYRSGMTILYPIVGLFTIFSSIGYLLYGIRELKRPRSRSQKNDPEKLSNKETENSDSTKKDSYLRMCLVFLLLLFIFLYVGMEVMYGTFVATFAVKSDLSLTRQEGANVNAIFWGSFAAMRFTAIFIAFKLSALSQMMLSFTLCTIGSIALAVAGNIHKYVLCISSALMGTGMASVYACGILWIEQHITVTNRIVSSMIISGSIGADLFPIVLGQFMATFPMLLMYLQVVVVSLCIILFSLAYFITRILSKNTITYVSTNIEELKPMT